MPSSSYQQLFFISFSLARWAFAWDGPPPPPRTTHFPFKGKITLILRVLCSQKAAHRARFFNYKAVAAPANAAASLRCFPSKCVPSVRGDIPALLCEIEAVWRCFFLVTGLPRELCARRKSRCGIAGPEAGRGTPTPARNTCDAIIGPPALSNNSTPSFVPSSGAGELSSP